MNWGMFLKTGLAAVLVLVANPAAGQNEKVLSGERACTAAVNERLKRMNVDPGDVRSISIAARIRSHRRDRGTPSGFDAWVALKSCRGSIVMNLNQQCRIKRVYSKGDCKVPN